MRVKAALLCLLVSIFWGFPLRFSGQSQSQLWSSVIAPNRAIDWSQAGANPGSPDTLPSANWKQCGTTLSAGTYSGSQIASTLASCPANTYYLLGPGTFTLTGSITMPRNGHVALRGSGANSTKIISQGSISGCNGASAVICMSGDGTYPGGPTTAYNWTGNYAQGTTQIILSSVSGIVLNQTLLVLNQCDTGFSGSSCSTGSSVDNGNYFVCSNLYNSGNNTGCGANGPDTGAWRSNAFEQEIVTVTAINAGGCGSTCVTISHPIFHPNWSAQQSPQAVLIQPIVQAGVENLLIDGSPSTSNQTGVGLQDALQCWVSGVTITNMYEFAVYGLDLSHTTVKDSYVYHSNGHPDAYAIRTTVADSDLIQNNIIQQWKNSYACDGPCVGEVVAYNYSIDQIVPSPSDQMWGSFWTHSAGDDFMLREGNAANQAQDDNVHGTHLNQTSLRNFFWGFESCINGKTGSNNCGGYAVKDQASTAFVESSGVRYSNNFGNVLGTPGFTTIYESTQPFSGFAAWNLGGGNGTVGLPTDPLVASTMVRWGNWDAVTGPLAGLLTGNGAMYCTAALVPSLSCTGDGRAVNAPLYPGLSSPSTTIPPSFYMGGKPSWWPSAVPFPAIGPDISNGNIGQCGGLINAQAQAGLPATSSSQCPNGPLNTAAWGGHVNANPAMSCYLNLGGLPDGTGPQLPFDSATCYGGGGSTNSGPPQAPGTPTNLGGSLH